MNELQELRRDVTIWRQGTRWLASTDGGSASGDSPGEAVARLYESLWIYPEKH